MGQVTLPQRMDIKGWLLAAFVTVLRGHTVGIVSS